MNILKKSKYVFVCLFLVCSIFLTLSNYICAEASSTKGIFDTVIKDGIYKLSDDKVDVYLPYIRYATDSIIMDKEISDMGILFSLKSIEVNSSTKDIQVLLAYDTVRINSNIEHGIIFAGSGVVINSNISKNSVILSNGDIVISEGVTIDDDIIVFCNNLVVNGTVKGSIVGAANTVNVNGKIERDLRLDVINANIPNSESILGEVYINTTNENINIKDIYPNAIVNVYKKKSNNISSKDILNVVTISFVFAVIYMIIKKASKGKAVSSALTKIKENSLHVVLFGTIFMLTIPLIFLILGILSLIGLSKITIPAFIVYIAFIIVVSMLSTLIVGSMMFEYVKEKYIKECNIWLELVGSFVTFCMLHFLTFIPKVGFYISLMLVILAIGIMICVIFKKTKNREVAKVEKV